MQLLNAFSLFLGWFQPQAFHKHFEANAMVGILKERYFWHPRSCKRKKLQKKYFFFLNF